MPLRGIQGTGGRWLALLLSSGLAHSATHEVTVENFRFSPNELEIEPGDTVRWTNVGGFHDVTDDAFTWASETGSGWVFERSFGDPGEVSYHCSVHSSPGQPIATGMNGRITVKPNLERVFSDGFESP